MPAKSADVSRDQIWISCPDSVHGNFGIQFMSPDNSERVKEFEDACMEHFWESWENRWRFHAFFQGGHSCSDWRYFEILGWRTDGVQDELFEFGLNLAERFGLELEIR